MSEMDDHTNYDFLIIVIPGDNFIIQIAINTAVYDESLIDALRVRIIDVIGQVLQHPSMPVESIQIPGLGSSQTAEPIEGLQSLFSETVSQEF
jgi:hypothetical protein